MARIAPATPATDVRGLGWELSHCAEPGDRARGALRLTLVARDGRGLSGDMLDERRSVAWLGLQSLAEAALGRAGTWRMRAEPFDHSWHMRRGGDWEPEIQFSAVLEPALAQDQAGGHDELGLRSALKAAFLERGVLELN